MDSRAFAALGGNVVIWITPSEEAQTFRLAASASWTIRDGFDACLTHRLGPEGGDLLVASDGEVLVAPASQEPVEVALLRTTFRLTSSFEFAPAERFPVVLAVQDVKGWPDLEFEARITSDAPFAWTSAASASLACAAQVEDFPEGEYSRTSLSLAAKGLRWSHDLSPGRGALLWAAVSSDGCFNARIERDGVELWRADHATAGTLGAEQGAKAELRFRDGSYAFLVPAIEGRSAYARVIQLEVPEETLTGLGDSILATPEQGRGCATAAAIRGSDTGTTTPGAVD